MKYIITVLFFLLFHAITLHAQPVVLGQPADTAICNGGRANFYVLAVNTVSFQWQENDGVGWYNITPSITYAVGFTSPVLTIRDANLGLNGYKYRCLVYDAQNTMAVSSAAKLGVNEPPVITNQPVDIVTCKNDIAVFSVDVLSATAYQWQESVGQGWVNLTNNAFYSGTRTAALSIFTTTGMNGFRYRCRILNGNCPDTTQSARLFVNPTPTIQTVLGGGAFCEGSLGVNIGLANSEAGIAYHLFRDGVGTGAVFPGTGTAVDFGRFTVPGTYTVKAINGSTTCSINMQNAVTIVRNPLPLQQQLQGGGSYCTGNQAPEIFITASEAQIKYDLFRNGIYSGISLMGSGFTLSFGQITSSGIYTVRAVNTTTNCSTQLLGNVQVTQNPIPIISVGNDISIPIGTMANLQAQTSNGSGNYSYQWHPAAFVQHPQQSATLTIPLYQSRLFIATSTDLNSQCASRADTLMVFVTGGSLDASIINSQSTVCIGTSSTLVSTASGGSGNYTFLWSSTPPGFSSNTSQVVVTPQQTTTYHLTVSDGISSVFRSVTIAVKSLPQIFITGGGGNYCSGSEGKAISLSGSELGVGYTLFRNGQPTSSKEGNGQPMSFGLFTMEGVYTVEGRNIESSCSRAMQSSATISMQQRPVANAGLNQNIVAGTSATFNGSASNGSGNYSFSWAPAASIINPNAASAITIPLFSTRLFQLVVTDQASGCISSSAEVVAFVSGGAAVSMQVTASAYNICPNEQVQLNTLATGGSGNYQYQWQSIPAGFSSTVYNPVVSPAQTTKYKITVSDGFAILVDSITIQVRAVPQQFLLAGGGSYCSSEQGPEITLSGSQASTYYSLFKNGEETGIVRSGTGGTLSFGKLIGQGIYQAKAFSAINLCWSNMLGNPSIQTIQVPLINAGLDKTVQNGNNVQLSATVSGGSGNYRFNWSPASMVLSPSTQSTLTIPLNQTTVFKVVAIDNQTSCQSNEDDVMIFVTGTALIARATPKQPIVCLGSTVNLSGFASGGSGSYSYYWTSIPAGYYSGAQSIIITPTVSTKYILNVSDGQNTVTDTVFVQVSSLPAVFQVVGGGNICQSGNTLPIGLSGSETGVVYRLFINQVEKAVVYGTGTAIGFGLFDAVGQYSVNAKQSASGCETTMSGTATITSGGAVIAEAGPDKYIVNNTQTVLNGSVIAQHTSYTFSWSPADKLINPTALQPNTKPLNQTTLFKLSVIPTGGGCAISEDYVTVFVSGSQMSVSILSDRREVCKAEKVSLFALPSGGTGSYIYSWSSIPSGFTASTFNPEAFPNVSTKYIVAVTDGTETIYDSVFISVKATPTQFQLQGGGDYCVGSSALSIGLGGSQIGTNYQMWRNNLPTGNILPGTGSSLTFSGITEGGLFSIQALNTNTQCPSNMIGTANVQVFQPPTVISSPDQTIIRGTSTSISGIASGGSGFYTYSWNPAYLVAQPAAASTQTLVLNSSTAFLFYAMDQASGCRSNTDTTFVFVKNGPLTAQILSSTNQVCAGDKITLSAIPDGGSGTYTFQWKDSSGRLLGSTSSIEVVVNQSQSYYLILNDGNQTADAQIFIEAGSIPTGFVLQGGGNVCAQSAGAFISLSASENNIIYALYLNFSQHIMSVVGTGSAIEFGYFSIPGIYTVQATRTIFGCKTNMLGSVTIRAFTPPQVDAGAFQTIPFGGSTQLLGTAHGGSGSLIYNWQPTAWLTNPNIAQPYTTSLQSSTLFTLKVIDLVSACEATAQTIVFVSGGVLSVGIASSATTICPGESVQLTALPRGGTGNYSISWSSQPSVSLSNNTTITVYPNQTTKYYLTVNDGVEIKRDSVLISLFPLPQSYQMVGGGLWCTNVSAPPVGLSGSQLHTGYSLFRNGYATGLTISGNNSAIDFGNITANGSYTVIATSSNGCKRLMSGSVQLEQKPPPANFNLFGGGSFCESDPANGLFLSGSENNTIYRLLRNEVKTDSITGNGMPRYFKAPTVSGIYTVVAVQVGSACSRTMSGSAAILIYPKPITLVTGRTSICKGETIALTASGGDSYRWLVQPPVLSNILNITPQSTTTYRVVVGNAFGCSKIDSLRVNVSPSPQFVLREDFSKQILYAEGALNSPQFIFRTGGQILQSGFSDQYFYGGTALVNDSISVEAINASGCKLMRSAVILGAENRVNAFSPNGDNMNDLFRQGSFIRVYNRWGKEIFAGDKGWDGRYNGVMSAPGTYFFIQDIKNADGKVVRTEKGSVTLVIE